MKYMKQRGNRLSSKKQWMRVSKIYKVKMIRSVSRNRKIFLEISFKLLIFKLKKRCLNIFKMRHSTFASYVGREDTKGYFIVAQYVQTWIYARIAKTAGSMCTH